MVLEASEKGLDLQTEAYCEMKAAKIQSLVRNTVALVAEIGYHLWTVKLKLPYGYWGSWVNENFDWTDETARKYIKLHEAVQKNPRILEFKSVELAIMFPSLPDITQETILREGRMKYAEAKEVIDEYDRILWREGIDDLVAVDPGKAYRAIESAMDIPRLREEAKESVRKHAEVFAIHGGTDVNQVMRDNGMSIGDRFPSGGDMVQATLVEGVGCASIIVGNIGLASFHGPLTDPRHKAMVNAMLQASCKAVGIR